MTNIDAAFESLAKRRKLAIPKVDVGPPPPVPDVAIHDSTDDDDSPADVVSTEMPSEPDFAPKRRTTPSVVVPASAILDPDAPDYIPHNEIDAGLRVAPTETDLRPVADETPPSPVPKPSRETTASGRIAEVLNLACVRRHSRFGYLPFAADGRLAESCRRLRAQILALAPERPSVLVTSAERGEGRTELAIRLALSLAKRPEAAILLADFDLRNPAVAPRLGLPLRQFALADALRGACPAEEAICYGEEDNLYVLAARPADREGDDLLDARQARRLLARLHATFDFVVMDCGPAGVDSAPILLGRQAGSVVLAARSGVARPSAVRRAAETLIAAGADVGGVVLMAAG